MSSLEIYFKQINCIPLLTAEQEKTLAAKARNGDKSAFDALVVSNLRFVAKVANSCKTFLKEDGLKIEDLIMEGNIALMTAAQKFDPAKDARFCTYAVWWIKNAIFRTLAKKIKTCSWTAARLDVCYKASDEDDCQPLVNYFPDEKNPDPEKEAVDANVAQTVRTALEALKPKEREVIKCHFGFGGTECMTLQQIGDKMGHTKEGIRQIEKSGLQKLRKQLAQVA
ncbi:MAG: sigma-70 family RNA polymerase sigma factor [Treponema sp.]|nr:sigma-70 family RNA polymerase sigma factor [Treponema sp.]